MAGASTMNESIEHADFSNVRLVFSGVSRGPWLHLQRGEITQVIHLFMAIDIGGPPLQGWDYRDAGENYHME